MSKIIWGFIGKEVTFQSTPENFERDQIRMALANKLEIGHKIKIHHDDRPTTSMPTNSDGDTTCPTVSTLSLGSKKTKTGKTTTELCDLPGDVDRVDSSSDRIQPTVDDSDISFYSDQFPG